MHSKNDLLKILKERFAHDDFKNGQFEVVSRVLAGDNLLVLMSTGSGKSLCYQLPALLFENLTIVISPLVALMEDQVLKARSMKLPFAAIHSGITIDKKQKILKLLQEDKLKLLYVTPERFKKSEFQQIVYSKKISMLVVDEAHSISQWGEDFRPDYSLLGELKKKLNPQVTLALTATATSETQKIILNQLGIHKSNIFLDSIKRENLKIQVHDIHGFESKIKILLDSSFTETTIIYFSLVTHLKKAQEHLVKKYPELLVYFGDLPVGVKKTVSKKFLDLKAPLLLATPAFGLGIDRSDIRHLVHFEIPLSVEAYFQEIGRAGRDGLPAKVQMLLDDQDLLTQMEFIKWSNPDLEFVSAVFKVWSENHQQFLQEGVGFLKEKLLYKSKHDYRVETVLKLFEHWGAMPEDKGLLLPENFNPAERIKKQSKKLYDLYQTLRSPSEEILEKIYAYFKT
jgi:ATP-dependent DNA helicase RecQ